MGIFTHYGLNTFDFDPESLSVNENYSNSEDMGIIMIESTLDEQENFNKIIMNDIKETTCKREGFVEEATQVLNEGFMDVINSIKEFIKKVWAKVKHLFKSFIAKFDSIVMKDNVQLYKKYSVEFNKNLAYGEDIKVKFATPTSKWAGAEEAGADEASARYHNFYGDIVKMRNDSDKLKAKQESFNDGTELDNFLGDVIGTTTDAQSFKKDAMEEWFDSKEKTEVTNDISKTIIEVMNTKNAVRDIEKASKAADRFFAGELKDITAAEKELYSKKDYSDSSKINIEKQYSTLKKNPKTGKESYQPVSDAAKKVGFTGQALSVLRSMTSTLQRGYQIYNSTYLAATKFNISQCRAAFIKIAMFKHKEEDALLDNAIYEAAEYDTELLFSASL